MDFIAQSVKKPHTKRTATGYNRHRYFNNTFLWPVCLAQHSGVEDADVKMGSLVAVATACASSGGGQLSAAPRGNGDAPENKLESLTAGTHAQRPRTDMQRT